MTALTVLDMLSLVAQRGPAVHMLPGITFAQIRNLSRDGLAAVQQSINGKLWVRRLNHEGKPYYSSSSRSSLIPLVTPPSGWSDETQEQEKNTGLVFLIASKEMQQLFRKYQITTEQIDGSVPIRQYEQSMMHKEQQWLRQLQLCFCQPVCVPWHASNRR